MHGKESIKQTQPVLNVSTRRPISNKFKSAQLMSL